MTTLTIQPDTTAGLDTELRSSAATTNYATQTTFTVGWVNSGSSIRRVVIKFDLSSLPAGCTVNSATFSLYCQAFSGTGHDFNVYPLLVSFTESQATWNKRDSGNNWSTAGAGGVGTDYNSTSLDVADAPTGTGQWVDFNLTTTWLEDVANSNTTNHGFVVRGTVEAGLASAYTTFYSSDYLTDSSLRPRLVIDYTPAATSLTPTKADLTTTARAPGLTPGAVSLTPTKATGTTTAREPGLSLGAVALTPTRATATATANDATVQGGAVVTPTTATGTVSANTPGLTLGAVSLTPAGSAITGTANAPGITLALTPTKAHVTATANQPGLSLVLTPSGASAAWTANQPSLSVSLTPTGATVAATANTPGLAVGAVSLTPVASLGTLLAGEPTLTLGAVALTPTKSSGVTTANAPTVTPGETRLTPAALALSPTFPAPTYTIGAAQATPDVLVWSVTIPTPRRDTTLAQAVIELTVTKQARAVLWHTHSADIDLGLVRVVTASEVAVGIGLDITSPDVGCLTTVHVTATTDRATTFSGATQTPVVLGLAQVVEATEDSDAIETAWTASGVELEVV